MQQFAIQSYVDRHQHGAGAAFFAILLAEGRCGLGRDSAVDRQEWDSNLHYLDARDSRRSWILAWQLAPAWWRRLLFVGAICGRTVAVAIQPE